ncbi:MAG TPA: RasGEF domain-containing protein, partial [Candidatus Berkiella sp.]|nr:RasGEF domain-containing protein [Candidatus Berkiella sp.]
MAPQIPYTARDARKVAADMLQDDMTLFLNVTTADLNTWEKKPASFAAVVADSNKKANIIRDDILLSNSPEEQMEKYSFYARLLDENMKLNNFHSAQAILSGLNDASIARLAASIATPEAAEIVNKHEKNLTQIGNFKELR